MKYFAAKMVECVLRAKKAPTTAADWRPRAITYLFTFLLISLAVLTSAEASLAFELGGPALGFVAGLDDLVQCSEPELSLLRSSIDEEIWLSAMSLAAPELARERRAPPLRVLHYMGTNFGMTGVETFILQLCAAQKRAGMIPAIAMELSGREEVRDVSAGLGIEVHGVPALRPFEERLPDKLGTGLLRARRIHDLARKLRKSDVLHIHAVGISCLDGFVAAGLSRTGAIVVTHHATLSWFEAHRNLLSDLTFWIEKRSASHVVMPYASAVAELVDAGIPEHRTSVIPFCVDEKLFSGLASLPEPGELTLVMPARMHEGKGQGHLLAAIAKLIPRYPRLRALLIGDGPTRPEIEAEIDNLDLRGAVTSLGRVGHREIPDLMRSAHVVVLPSYMQGEMFPLCLIEGMALGLPAIGARWSGIPEIIEDGETGILVEPRDEEALAGAIERFLAEPEFYAQAREKALARFQSRYAASAVASAYSAHYEAALNCRGSA